ncbi:MAG: hypothetical protein R6X29_04490 [Acidimicrobiia bacterium]
MSAIRAETAVRVLDGMAEAGIAYCVLRNHEQIRIEPGRDVDLVAEPGRVDEVEAIIADAADELGWDRLVRCRGHHEGTSYYFLSGPGSDGKPIQLELHFTRVRWAGATILTDRDLLDGRRMSEAGIWVAAEHHTAVQRILQYGLSGQLGEMKADYWPDLVRIARDDRESVARSLHRVLPDERVVESVVDGIVAGDLGTVAASTGTLRRAFLAGAWRDRLKDLPSIAHQTFDRVVEPRRSARCGVVGVAPAGMPEVELTGTAARLSAMFLQTAVVDGGAVTADGANVVRTVNRAGLVLLRTDDPALASDRRWRAVACPLVPGDVGEGVARVVSRFVGNHQVVRDTAGGT